MLAKEQPRLANDAMLGIKEHSSLTQNYTQEEWLKETRSSEMN